VEEGVVSVGQSAERIFHVTEAVVEDFADLSGDRNPVHLDESYASKTRFGGRVAHGMILGGYISAILAHDLPGAGCVYLEQSLSFKRPVRIGEIVRVRLTVTSSNQQNKVVTLQAQCFVEERLVAEGVSIVLAPDMAVDAA
jgi:3-hydroxybutyryl-CoA dehydratase